MEGAKLKQHGAALCAQACVVALRPQHPGNLGTIWKPLSLTAGHNLRPPTLPSSLCLLSWGLPLSLWPCDSTSREFVLQTLNAEFYSGEIRVTLVSEC